MKRFRMRKMHISIGTAYYFVVPTVISIQSDNALSFAKALEGYNDSRLESICSLRLESDSLLFQLNFLF